MANNKVCHECQSIHNMKVNIKNARIDMSHVIVWETSYEQYSDDLKLYIEFMFINGKQSQFTYDAMAENEWERDIEILDKVWREE